MVTMGYKPLVKVRSVFFTILPVKEVSPGYVGAGPHRWTAWPHDQALEFAVTSPPIWLTLWDQLINGAGMAHVAKFDAETTRAAEIASRRLNGCCADRRHIRSRLKN